jgi:acetylornithine deacetylase/succinyl-diaminopimelate desuccinylase-like protein
VPESTERDPFRGKLDSLIDRDELRDFLLGCVAIPSPTGRERPMAEYLAERFSELGMEVQLQDVEPDRPNVVARLQGTGGGPTLMFNGHMDTSVVGDEPGLQMGNRNVSGVLDDEWVYGNGSSNMKAAFPAYYGAIKAIRDAGIQVKGDIVVCAVVGEIEQAPIDQWQGRDYRGGGIGTRWLLLQGVLADMAIIGEPNGLRVQPGNTGYVFVRIATYGIGSHTWSKENGVDAIAAMTRIQARLQAWEAEYQARHPHPRMAVRIGVSGILGGFPYKPSLTPAPYCFLYLHVTTLPGQDLLGVRDEIDALLDDIRRDEPRIQADVSLYLARPGYEIAHDHALVISARRAHEQVLGAPSAWPAPNRYSVSSDGSILAEYGIPAITYGPGGFNRGGAYNTFDAQLGEILSLSRLVECTKVYALAAADLCLRDRGSWLVDG